MFKFLWLPAIFLFLTSGVALAQSYGLSFNSHDVVQEKRTSLDLSPGDSLCFEKKMTLQFDMRLMPNKPVYFGYLVRIINGNQNIDIICSQNQFKIVNGQQLTNIAFTIDTVTLYNKWSTFSLSIDLAARRLQFALNDKNIGQCDVQLSGHCYRFLWGANDDQRFNTRDIPPMRIRDVQLLNGGKPKHHWVLADTSGAISTDLISKKQARIKNAVWVKPLHQHWQLEADFKVAGIAGVTYVKAFDYLYIPGADSMYIYSPGPQNPGVHAYSTSHVNMLHGHQLLWDSMHKSLLDLYIDQKRVMHFDDHSKGWSYSYKDTLLTEFWHANKFLSPVDSSIYIIGGYGQLKYKNTVQRCKAGRWETIQTSGDPLPPRYLAALSTNAAGDTAYIMGGYGSVTGDQMVNPGNYYDLYTFDVRRHRFAKRYTFKPFSQHVAFANSLVIPPPGNEYYGLIFPNGSFNSNLQLVHGSLQDSTMQLLGSTIPYSFHDIQSYADLFYSPKSNKLLAVTFFYSGETEKAKSTQVKIWSIDFPPESVGTPVVTNTAPAPTYWWWLLALLPVGLLFFVKRKRTAPVMAAETEPVPVIHDRSVIRLFGQFHVTDKDGHDITKQFTPLLKELFLLILIYTIRSNKGISSEALNEILWHDKPVKDAKNNRSVNLAKLKPILEKVGSCVINKDTGAWEVHCEDNSVWIDYQEFMMLLQDPGSPGRILLRRLLRIVERGPFLQQTEYNWLDDIKSEVSTQVLDRCQRYIELHHATDDPEFIIEICNTIFLFDRLNEDALRYKCQSLITLKRHAMANTTYLSFTKEYKEIYGEDFPRSFNEIIK